MQDRYVGDAGDYAKFSLLKSLVGEEKPSRLGVLWYLFPDEGHNGDGRHVRYLNDPVMALRDPDTHTRLARLVRSGRRSVASVQLAKILPPNTVFHSTPVAVCGSPSARIEHRSRWFEAGLERVGAADLIFFDPDNGIETQALKKSDFRAGKYAFWEEIEAAWGLGKSLVVYNHLNRSAPAPVQTERLRSLFADRLARPGAIVPLLFRRGSCRHMWVIAQPSHCSRLMERIQGFLERGWNQDTDTDLPVANTYHGPNLES